MVLQMKKIVLLFVTLITGALFMHMHSQQTGKASFYAPRFQGKKMSNGIPYHGDSLTCAHRTLPFGTMLEVRNPENDRRVVVKVTDRGPRIRSRLIDLSYAAAKELDIVARGIAQVEIKEWVFNPFYLPIPVPFGSYGLFVSTKTAAEILSELTIDKSKPIAPYRFPFEKE